MYKPFLSYRRDLVSQRLFIYFLFCDILPSAQLAFAHCEAKNLHTLKSTNEYLKYD